MDNNLANSSLRFLRCPQAKSRPFARILTWMLAGFLAPRRKDADAQKVISLSALLQRTLGLRPGFGQTTMRTISPALFMRRANLALLAAWAAMATATGSNFYQGVASNSVPWPGGIVPYLFTTNVSPAEQVVYLG